MVACSALLEEVLNGVYLLADKIRPTAEHALMSCSDRSNKIKINIGPTIIV